MTASINIGAPYHQQDTNYYCGAASAQMILDKIAGGLLGQDALYTITHGNPPVQGWYTHPNGLKTVLNGQKPAGFGAVFTVDTHNDIESSMASVFAALSGSNAPVAALVQSGNHWVVLHGVQTDPPANPGAQPTVIGVWINDPWPPVPAAGAVPPHADPDACAQTGQPNQYVAWSAWNSNYFNATDIGNGSAQFVSVLASPVAVGGKMPVLPQVPVVRFSFPRFLTNLMPKRSISENDAIDSARRGAVRHGLVSEEKTLVRQIVEPSKSPDDAFLVQRLDAKNSHYYLVLTRSGSRGPMFSMVEQQDGEFAGTRFISDDEAARVLTRQALQQRLQEMKETEIPGLGVVQTENALVEPTLVWKPCDESRSPYFPFYRIHSGPATFFSTLEGTLYSELHTKELRG